VITPPASCQSVADAAHTVLNLVPLAGHAGYVERPDVYTANIEQFCRRCEGNGET
jgi:hypothetical protein